MIWEHAINSLTTNRENSKILNAKYVERLWDHCYEEILYKHLKLSKANESYLKSWLDFSASIYSTKKTSELKIAYLCGPEPINDLSKMLNLGVSIENVWAFESDKEHFQSALENIQSTYPTLKVFNGKIDTFLEFSPLKFDIIYLDFTAPIFSDNQKPYKTIHAIFDQQALSELGILIVNSCFPDKDDCSKDFLKSYFKYQTWVENTITSNDPEEYHDGSYGESFEVHGIYEDDEILKYIDKNFWYSYSAFSTHYPSYYANMIQPIFRVLKNPVTRKRIFNNDKGELNKSIGHFTSKEEYYEEPTEYAFQNFLSDLGGCKTNDSFLKYFQVSENQVSRSHAVDVMYLYKHSVYDNYQNILSPTLQDAIPQIMRNIPDSRGGLMGLFCDIPMIHLWLELAINQYGYVHHSNVENHKRHCYTAKEREMCIDIFTYDQCRSLYDWLPMIEFYAHDLSITERQMITRICIDAIGKHRLYNFSELYYASALIGMGEKSWAMPKSFDKRENINEMLKTDFQ